MPRQRANAPGPTQEVVAPMQGERYPDWLMERFWAKVDKTDDCWLWTGATTGAGYGSFRDSVAAKRVDTHRFVYAACVGPIPDGLVIDHLCTVKLCVNPAHMEPVTHRTNVLRSGSHVALNDLKTQCPRGHAYAGDNVRVTPQGHRICRECHRQANRRLGLETLTPKQERILAVAVRNGRWWIAGKGSNMVVAGLVQRGLVEKRWELLAGRHRHYVVPTDEGRSLDAARKRRGA
jgi:hypothetical protein